MSSSNGVNDGAYLGIEFSDFMGIVDFGSPPMWLSAIWKFPDHPSLKGIDVDNPDVVDRSTKPQRCQDSRSPLLPKLKNDSPNCCYKLVLRAMSPPLLHSTSACSVDILPQLSFQRQQRGNAIQYSLSEDAAYGLVSCGFDAFSKDLSQDDIVVAHEQFLSFIVPPPAGFMSWIALWISASLSIPNSTITWRLLSSTGNASRPPHSDPTALPQCSSGSHS